MQNEFEKFLIKKNLSKKTISSYLQSVNLFNKNFENVNKKNLLEFKGWLLENYKTETVNLRIIAINKYLEFLNKSDLKIKGVKTQQKTFLENVISDADYTFLKRKLKKDGYIKWYFIVRYLGATGARIGELVELKVEHVFLGYFDIYGKGGKLRRLFIPKILCEETKQWLKNEKREEGYLFLNEKGFRIGTRGISIQLKTFAKKYGINPHVVYPHSFRHRFAKNFLLKFNDIALLADLMGHESIETTRIYLRRTASEQQALVDKIVTW